MSKEKKLYKYCLRCGRKLKTIESREIGYGKVCYEKTLKDKKLYKNLFTISQ